MDLNKIRSLLQNDGEKVVIVEDDEPTLVVSRFNDRKKSPVPAQEMLVVSNHLLNTSDLPFPGHVVVRVNVAWIPTKDELISTLSKITHDIYLDYPQGRTKPPRPKISLDDAISMAHRFPKVKHFAVSNVEDPEAIFAIKVQLPSRVALVPKIETKKGIENLEAIVAKIQNRHIMFDKEDLYIDVNRDAIEFERLVELTRQKSKALGIGILELHGVVFLPYKHK